MKLEVEDRAGNISEDFLLDVLVDTIVPPVSIFQVVSDDTGADGFAATGVDRVTSDTTLAFSGRAEADAIVRVYVDDNANNAIDGTAFSLTVAEPLDGDEAFPNGQWGAEFWADVNDPALFATDGIREVFVRAEDLAGNLNTIADGVGDDGQRLLTFIDTQGPEVTGVELARNGVQFDTYNIFDAKLQGSGTLVPTPLSNTVSLFFSDDPARQDDDPNFLYDALLEQVAENSGNYQLVGDHNGVIPIQDVTFNRLILSDDAVATARVDIRFAVDLPDDRFTLTVSDALVDIAGNPLDGETNTTGPLDNPTFPSGDGVPGGDFVARFTVDSRPEIGTTAGGSIYIDINANGVWDPENPDFANRDIPFVMGFTADNVFNGNFVQAAGDVADGFDKLAVFGPEGNDLRWLIDFDNDGVYDLNQTDNFATNNNIHGTPVAGDFDGNPANGDEVGLFTGTQWFFDTNHNFQLNAGSVINTDLRGQPIVGDFDNDGADDLGLWRDDRFFLDLAADGLDGELDEEFFFGFIGAREVPLAADINQDGYDDIGLWVPDREGQPAREAAEWYFLVSTDTDQDGVANSVLDRIRNTDFGPAIDFTPTPFGEDVFFQFGDDFALPLVGNFDPPVSETPFTGDPNGGNLNFNTQNPRDVNADGSVTTRDLAILVREITIRGQFVYNTPAASQPYTDVNRDGSQSIRDIAALLQHLVREGNGEAEGESSAIDQALAETDLLDFDLLSEMAFDSRLRR